MLKAVRKKRAYEDIVKQIRHLIEKGKLKRGDQLPTERELSETLKVSRTTVREAIFSLELIKLVQRRQGEGTYVIASSEEALVQPLASALFHEKDDMMDILFIRKIIEPEVAHLAAKNATPEEINELEKILKEQERETASGESTTRTDSNFHHLLFHMTKNKALERLLLALFDLMEKTREKYFQTEERKQKSLDGHQNIFAAIKSGNPKAAREAMRRHIENVENILFKKRKGGERGSLLQQKDDGFTSN